MTKNNKKIIIRRRCTGFSIRFSLVFHANQHIAIKINYYVALKNQLLKFVLTFFKVGVHLQTMLMFKRYTVINNKTALISFKKLDILKYNR